MPTLAQRALMTRLNHLAHGVAITLTTAYGSPVTTTGIWHEDGADAAPVGAELQMSGRRPRVMAIRQSAFAGAKKQGAVIQAQDAESGAVKTWIVDGTIREDAEQVWVQVIPA